MEIFMSHWKIISGVNEIYENGQKIFQPNIPQYNEYWN